MSKPTLDPHHIPHTSPDLHAELLAQLRALHPPLFGGEGKLDARELQALVAGYGVPEVEKFEFRWAGKQASKRIAFTPSKARLQPDEKRSMDFATTGNCIIEGDNLEVLKLLRKSYYGQVKCIYIDPPYNTGKDFIYPDNYREDKQAYWEQNGIVHDGVHMDTNTESAGRYHSNWLNMMQGRLLLARQLLRDDGVIFVSIDDHEVHNLRKLMDEVFGEENFVEQIIWKNKFGAGARNKFFISVHEYILCYTKNTEVITDISVPLSEKVKKIYNKRDENFDTLGPYATWPLETTSMDERPNLRFPILYEGKEIWPKKQWLWSKERVEQAQKANRLVITERNGKCGVRFKGYLREENGEEKKGKPLSIFDGPYTQEGTKEINELFGHEVFPFPKPVQLLRKLINFYINDSDDRGGIILDFFAGSGTTAQAVMELNKEDGGNRKFILVQLPEETDEKSEARKAGYKTISQITIERVKRAGAKVKAEKSEVDTGFRVFALTKSFFPENNYVSDPAKTEADNVQAFREYVARTERQYSFPFDRDELLYEIALKDGFALNLTATKLPEFPDNIVFRLTDGEKAALMCLDHDLRQPTVDRLIADHKQDRFICLHRALDDTKKWNLNHTLGPNLWVT